MSDRPLPPQFTRGPEASRCADGQPHRRVITVDERWETAGTHDERQDGAARRYQLVRVGYCLECRRHILSRTDPSPFGPWIDAGPGALDLHGAVRDRRAG